MKSVCPAIPHARSVLLLLQPSQQLGKSARWRCGAAWRQMVSASLLALTSLVTGCGAATPDAPLPSDHDPSTDSAALALTLSGPQLSAELRLPARPALGFDHRPTTADEREQLQVTIPKLRDGAALLGLPAAAGCEQRTIRVESPLLAVYDDRDRQRPAGAAPPAPTDARTPNDFRALYQFECALPGALNALAPTLLEQFPRLQRVDVEWQGGRAGAITAIQSTVALPGD